MKKIAFVLFLTLNAQASTLTLFCDNHETPNSCGARANAAVEKLGCVVERAETKCTYSLIEDPRNPGSTIKGDSPYCELTSANCSSPLPGNFGGENCFDREKVRIAKADGVHNGYWFGLFRSYSRTVCRDR